MSGWNKERSVYCVYVVDKLPDSALCGVQGDDLQALAEEAVDDVFLLHDGKVESQPLSC